MQATLQRLIDVYRRELELYDEIRNRVFSQRRLIESDAGYKEINVELQAKHNLLVEIEVMESRIRVDRQIWTQRKHTLDSIEAKTLMNLLAEVSRLVEEIMTYERENEVLLTSRRRFSRRAAMSVKGAATEYRRQSLVEVER
ncbi:MAG: hypothetical protein GY835_19960 [bacterium]|nr:hypothetical protein [bacterium]